MSTLYWMAAGLVGLAAIIWLASKWGAAKASKVVAEDVAKIQKAMAEADAAKPATVDELVERLRKAGL